MFSLKNVHLYQKINFLILSLVFGFLVISACFYIHISAHQGALRLTSTFDQQHRLLSAIRFDLLNLNKLLVERFYVGSESLNNRQSELRASLKDNISALMNSVDNSPVNEALMDLEEQLSSFDIVNQNIALQQDLLGENAKDGLLLEIALVAEQFETVLVELNSGLIKEAVLDMRRDEKSLIEHPNNETLTKIDEKIYGLINLLSKVRQPQQQSDFIMSIVGEYSKKLSQIVSVSEGIMSLEGDLIRISEKLTASASGIQANHVKFSESALSQQKQRALILSIAAVLVAMIVLVLLFVFILAVRKASLGPLAQLKNMLAELNGGRLDARVYLSTNDEFGLLAKGLNQFLDISVRELLDKSEELSTQNNDIDSLIQSINGIASQQRIEYLPVIEGRVGAVATAVNRVNEGAFTSLNQVKSNSLDIKAIAGKMQIQFDVVEGIVNDQLKQVLGTNKALKVLAKAITDVAERGGATAGLFPKIRAHGEVNNNAVVALINGIAPLKGKIKTVEKRMEGILELSQNIQEIVKKVNVVADRAHILALNTSMCVEPKNGLGVVDDLQELAQHARAAGREVLAMVELARNELFDTINVMNDMVEGVVEGVHLAEYANERMSLNDTQMESLESEVRFAATNSAKHATLMHKIVERANVIRLYTEKELVQLSVHKLDVAQLLGGSESLLTHVNGFQLPDKWLTTLNEQQKSERVPTVSTSLEVDLIEVGNLRMDNEFYDLEEFSSEPQRQRNTKEKVLNSTIEDQREEQVV